MSTRDNAKLRKRQKLCLICGARNTQQHHPDCPELINPGDAK